MLLIQQQFGLSNLSLPLKQYKTPCFLWTYSCSDLSKSHAGRSMSQLVRDPLGQASFHAVASRPLTQHRQPRFGESQLRYVPSPQSASNRCNFKQIISSKDIRVYGIPADVYSGIYGDTVFPMFSAQSLMCLLFPACEGPISEKAVVKTSSLAMY